MPSLRVRAVSIVGMVASLYYLGIDLQDVAIGIAEEHRAMAERLVGHRQDHLTPLLSRSAAHLATSAGGTRKASCRERLPAGGGWSLNLPGL